MPTAARTHRPTHQHDRRLSDRRYDAKRGPEHAFYTSARWRRLREVKLSSQPLCEECESRGLTVAAYVVDHIQPRAERPDLELDLDNLRSLCASCHTRKSNMERYTGLITIVAGPPGAGKTTYVMERRKPGDLIIDLDAILSAISGEAWYHKHPSLLPFAWQARDAMLEWLAGHPQRAWVIGMLGKRGERERLANRLSAKIVVLDVPRDECLRRIESHDLRTGTLQDWGALIDEWWGEYEA